MERTPPPEPLPLPPPPAERTEVRRTLRPGQRGAKKLLRIHGADLVCVRYRYDARGGLRLKDAGARWDAALRLWRLRYDKAVALRLRSRLVSPQRPQKGSQK